MAKNVGYGIDAQMRMQSFVVESKQIKARIFRYRMMFSKEVKIDETLTFDFSGGFDLETGSSNSSIIDVYAPERQLRLRKAVIAWKPSDLFELEAGALQQASGYNLIIGRSPFFGARANFELKFGTDYKLYAHFQESIPNNYFLAERIGTIEDEGTPHFSKQTAGLSLKGNILAFEQSFSRYSYTKLSSSVANQSQFLGNSISGGGNVNSKFLYGFTGIHSFTRANIYLSENFGIDLVGAVAFNDDAPDRINQGIRLTAGLIYGAHSLRFHHFRIESDVAPAFYNGNRFAFNNTEGFDITLTDFRPIGVESKKRGISYALTYNHNEPIDGNINQSPEDRITFYLQKNFGL